LFASIDFSLALETFRESRNKKKGSKNRKWAFLGNRTRTDNRKWSQQQNQKPEVQGNVAHLLSAATKTIEAISLSLSLVFSHCPSTSMFGT
jgi:hypothetical protein